MEAILRDEPRRSLLVTQTPGLFARNELRIPGPTRRCHLLPPGNGDCILLGFRHLIRSARSACLSHLSLVPTALLPS